MRCGLRCSGVGHAGSAGNAAAQVVPPDLSAGIASLAGEQAGLQGQQGKRVARLTGGDMAGREFPQILAGIAIEAGGKVDTEYGTGALPNLGQQLQQALLFSRGLARGARAQSDAQQCIDTQVLWPQIGGRVMQPLRASLPGLVPGYLCVGR